MSKANRSTVCASSGKRLRRKSWYYRNGKYYFSKRYFTSEQAKGAGPDAEAAAETGKTPKAEKPKAEKPAA